MARRMFKIQFRFAVSLGLLLFSTVPASSQLVRDDSSPPAPPDANHAQSSVQVPVGSKRLGKDFTLKGDSHWTDTDIEVQPGEHVLISASGKLRNRCSFSPSDFS